MDVFSWLYSAFWIFEVALLLLLALTALPHHNIVPVLCAY